MKKMNIATNNEELHDTVFRGVQAGKMKEKYANITTIRLQHVIQILSGRNR